MKIEFSNHSLDQIKKRNITKISVIKTINDPDEILPSYRKRKLIRKSFNDKILEVVTTIENNKVIVITAYLLKEDE